MALNPDPTSSKLKTALAALRAHLVQPGACDASPWISAIRELNAASQLPPAERARLIPELLQQMDQLGELLGGWQRWLDAKQHWLTEAGLLDPAVNYADARAIQPRRLEVEG
jgi:hypothetical protein